jgi:hypothetical protein
MKARSTPKHMYRRSQLTRPVHCSTVAGSSAIIQLEQSASHDHTMLPSNNSATAVASTATAVAVTLHTRYVSSYKSWPYSNSSYTPAAAADTGVLAPTAADVGGSCSSST